jgi:hypothetical protein
MSSNNLIPQPSIGPGETKQSQLLPTKWYQFSLKRLAIVIALLCVALSAVTSTSGMVLVLLISMQVFGLTLVALVWLVWRGTLPTGRQFLLAQAVWVAVQCVLTRLVLNESTEEFVRPVSNFAIVAAGPSWVLTLRMAWMLRQVATDMQDKELQTAASRSLAVFALALALSIGLRPQFPGATVSIAVIGAIGMSLPWFPLRRNPAARKDRLVVAS